MLNTVLSVREAMPASHSAFGWQTFTDEVIRQISLHKENVVFMLWGGLAKQKLKLIDQNKHLVLQSGHPSPLSANRGYWFGNKHFSKANEYLQEKGKTKIQW